MKRYKKIEQRLARTLASFPRTKETIKLVYQYFTYLQNRASDMCLCDYELKDFTPPGMETFIGYYDKVPISKDYYILCHLSKYSTRQKPNTAESISVMLFVQNEIRPILEVPTHVYNWQQGARAHWIDDDIFIFNDFDQDGWSYISRVFSKEKLKEVNRFDLPVQDSFGTHYFLSINYRRLMALRPDYGYRNLPPLNKAEQTDTENDGIWRVDFATGNSMLLYSLSQIAKVDFKPEFARAIHKVNHVMISPSGNEFIFLHRYYLGKRRLDRLMLADSEGKGLRVLADHGMVSHYFWADENTILVYLRGPNNRDGYYLIDKKSRVFTTVANGALDSYGDGHPHVRGDWFVTDTYPDKAQMQHLLLCNWKTGEFKELGEFFHGFDYRGETRCDLHPRLSLDGKSVFFDSVFDGKRRLYKMDLGA